MIKFLYQGQSSPPDSGPHRGLRRIFVKAPANLIVNQLNSFTIHFLLFRFRSFLFFCLNKNKSMETKKIKWIFSAENLTKLDTHLFFSLSTFENVLA